MERRTFTILSAGAMISLFLPSLNCSEGVNYANMKVPGPRDLSLICDSNEIVAIGNTYLKSKPDEAEIEKLNRLLFSDEVNGTEKASVNEEELSGLMILKVKKDFEQGSIIELNGWILSVTEARQCALFSLRQN